MDSDHASDSRHRYAHKSRAMQRHHTETLLRHDKASDKMSTARRGTGCSEEIRLLHDAQELLFVNLPVSVSVGFIDHLLQFLVGHPLAELLCDPLQILEGDLACLVVVKEAEGLQDLVFGISVQDLVSHHLQELLVADRATAIVVHIGNHLLDLLLLGLKAKGTHRDLQLFAVDLSRAIGVEEVESFFDLLLLFFSQLLLLLTSGVETTKRHAPM